MQTEAKSPPASSKHPSWRRNRMKNARQRDEERQRPACTRRQNPCRHSRNGQAGGEMGRKMHAGEMKKGRGQRANGGKIPAGTVETAKLAEKQNKKCTPVRRGKAEASVHTEAKSPPSQSKRPSRRRNGKKNARRRGEEQQGPACKRRQNPRRHRRDGHAGGETG